MKIPEGVVMTVMSEAFSEDLPRMECRLACSEGTWAATGYGETIELAMDEAMSFALEMYCKEMRKKEKKQ